MRGVSAPRAEVLLFRQKDPKPLAPGRGPSGAFAPVPTVRAAELASLRQSSPPNRVRDWGAAPPAGAMRWRQKLAHSFVPRPLGEGRVRGDDSHESANEFVLNDRRPFFDQRK